MIIPNIWENKKCSKPPTSWYLCNLRQVHFLEKVVKMSMVQLSRETKSDRQEEQLLHGTLLLKKWGFLVDFMSFFGRGWWSKDFNPITHPALQWYHEKMGLRWRPRYNSHCWSWFSCDIQRCFPCWVNRSTQNFSVTWAGLGHGQLASWMFLA